MAEQLRVDKLDDLGAGFVYMLLPLIKRWSSWNQNNGFAGLLEHAYHRRSARTSKGYYCLVPSSARVGDLIGVFQGGEVPLVIRGYGEDWKLVGESYFHGIMHGEASVDSISKTFWFR